MKLSIAYSSDDYYFKFAYTSISSLLKFNEDIEEIEIFMIDNQIQEANKALLLQLISSYQREIHFLPFTEFKDDLKNARYFLNSLSNYGRLFLSRVTDLDKILYIDCDTIVRDSLKELWELDINEYYIAGVQDTVCLEDRIKIGLSKDDRYINSGVTLINLTEWRKHGLEKKAVEYIDRMKGDISSPDQDILNMLCKGKILILDPKYNVMSSMFSFSAVHMQKFFEVGRIYYNQKQLDDALGQPVILHFTAGFFLRPWVINSDHPRKECFRQFYDASPWKGQYLPFAKKSLRTRGMLLALKYLPFPLAVCLHRMLRRIKKIYGT